jgi:hypothetical protein
MTGESHNRPTQRMSRFSQAYRTMPSGGEGRASFEGPVENVLSRADDAGRASAQWQRYSPPHPYAEVIEVEFETVPPAAVEEAAAATQQAARPSSGRGAAHPSTIRDFEAVQGAAGESQPPPPDIEAIAAALAEEMDRNAARNAKPVPEQPQEPPAVDLRKEVAAAALPEEPPVAETPEEAAAALPPDELPAEEPREAAPAAELRGEVAEAKPFEAKPHVEVAVEPRVEIVAPREAEDAVPPVAAASVAVPQAPEQNAASPAPSLVPEPIASAESHSAKAASQISRLTAQISPLARQAGHLARTKIAPAMVRAGFWLAQNLRRKEIRRRYGMALALAHGRVIDRRLEQHFFIPSLKGERFAPDPKRGILYEGPIPASAFNWVMSVLPEDLREYAFVDFRGGLGRAMLLASQRRFECIIGYEFGAAAYDDLQMNIAQFPRSQMLCRNVECHRGDRTGVSIPDQPCVLYVANAWRDEEFLDGIMTYLGESYRHNPRRLFLILENVDEKVALPKDDIFYRVDLPLAEKLKLRLLSPMDFQVYRTLV